MIEYLYDEENFTPKFVKPKRIHYKQKGKQRSWEILEVHDSVAILLYHKDKDAFILVKQFRPAIYLKNQNGYTYELCAGIVDKKASLKQIALEEIYEECGYKVKLDEIEEITSFYTSVGFAGGKQTLYFCEVGEQHKEHEGGGLEDEDIEVIYLHLSDAKRFIYDTSRVKTPGLTFAFMWYFDNK
jgi:UDP-sugar diphosphatase